MRSFTRITLWSRTFRIAMTGLQTIETEMKGLDCFPSFIILFLLENKTIFQQMTPCLTDHTLSSRCTSIFLLLLLSLSISRSISRSDPLCTFCVVFPSVRSVRYQSTEVSLTFEPLAQVSDSIRLSSSAPMCSRNFCLSSLLSLLSISWST